MVGSLVVGTLIEGSLVEVVLNRASLGWENFELKNPKEGMLKDITRVPVDFKENLEKVH